MLAWSVRRKMVMARFRKGGHDLGGLAVRTWERSSSKSMSRMFSRGGARLAELDLRVFAGQQLVVMKLPDATGVVQRPCGVLCQRVDRYSRSAARTSSGRSARESAPLAR
jgi:hypothetical protein